MLEQLSAKPDLDFEIIGPLEPKLGLALFKGQTPHLVSQIIANSLQPHILNSTPRDAAERFVNPTSFNEWYSKGKILHSSIDKHDNLAGIIWYGKSECPLPTEDSPNYTFAIRLYEGYVGRGLAKSFMLQSLAALLSELNQKNQLDDFNGIWLQTDSTNQPAIRAYENFGYTVVDTSDSDRVTMILKPEAIYTFATNPHAEKPTQ